MARVTVVTDSSACLPAADADRLGIRVLPITIRTPTGDFPDGTPAGSRAYEALRRGEPVKSTAPTPMEYLTVVEDSEQALVVTPATEFTTMHRNASIAAELADRPIAVLDSRTAAAAQGLVVLAAARAAADGAALDEALGVAEDAARRADLVAALESVEHVRRSGRVPAFAVDLARRLGVRPVFRLREGKVERLGVPRNEGAALERMRREWSGSREEGPVAVFHASAPERAEELARRLGGSPMVCEFSPAMGIHTGPGVVGIAWLHRDA